MSNVVMRYNNIMKHLNIKIYGKVQMVLFRYSAKEKADELGIFGFARNEPDGTIYIEAEGEDSALRQFTEWCKQGPKSARVDKIEIKEGEFKKFKNFTTY